MSESVVTFRETVPTSEIERYARNYERDGFIRVPSLVAPEEVPVLRAALDRYIRDVLPTLPKGDYVMEADGKSPRNLWRMELYDPFFKVLSERPDMQRLIARLVRGLPLLAAVESFCKPARVGSAVPAHQDNAYFCQCPPDMLTVWIAMDAATEANGPVTYIKGSHRGGLKPHRASGINGNSVGLVESPSPDSEAVFTGLLQPGDALIHQCETIHYSSPNRSEASRWGLLLVMRGAHTQKDTALKAAYEKARQSL